MLEQSAAIKTKPVKFPPTIPFKLMIIDHEPLHFRIETPVLTRIVSFRKYRTKFQYEQTFYVNKRLIQRFKCRNKNQVAESFKKTEKQGGGEGGSDWERREIFGSRKEISHGTQRMWKVINWLYIKNTFKHSWWHPLVPRTAFPPKFKSTGRTIQMTWCEKSHSRVLTKNKSEP